MQPAFAYFFWSDQPYSVNFNFDTLVEWLPKPDPELGRGRQVREPRQRGEQEELDP